jgi:hypothetical protein
MPTDAALLPKYSKAMSRSRQLAAANEVYAKESSRMSARSIWWPVSLVGDEKFLISLSQFEPAVDILKPMGIDMRKVFHRFIDDRSGATAIEYGIPREAALVDWDVLTALARNRALLFRAHAGETTFRFRWSLYDIPPRIELNHPAMKRSQLSARQS